MRKDCDFYKPMNFDNDGDDIKGVFDPYGATIEKIDEAIATIRKHEPSGKYLSAYVIENGKKQYIKTITYMGGGYLMILTHHQSHLLIHATTLRVAFVWQDKNGENLFPLVETFDKSKCKQK